MARAGASNVHVQNTGPASGDEQSHGRLTSREMPLRWGGSTAPFRDRDLSSGWCTAAGQNRVF